MLALHDATALLDAVDVAGALDLEALGASHDLLHPAIAAARPSPGVRETLARLRELREGSEVPVRNLQDPLTFRTLPQLHGAARDAFRFVDEQVRMELNAAQSNPLVVVDERRLVSVGNFEAQALATALDLARLALAPVLSSAAERAVKLLQAPLTGLPEGLGARRALAESALSELGIAVQAFAGEARLLAQPVSLEIVSTGQAEAIEDRGTLAPLAGRRLAEMVELGARVVAVELCLAAQACELRGAAPRRRHRSCARGGAQGRTFCGRGRPAPRSAAARGARALGAAGMSEPAAVDFHQHLWPESFLGALSRRAEPPRLDGDELVLAEGRFAASLQAHVLETRLEELDRIEVETAVVSLQPSFGLEELPEDERRLLEEAWTDGVSELVAASRGRLLALAPGRMLDGFVGATVPASTLLDLERVAPHLDELERRGGLLFVHPGVSRPPPGSPPWWASVVDYTMQMQAAYLRLARPR